MDDEIERREYKIDSTIAKLSVEQIVGQLIVTGFSGFTIPDSLSKLINQHLIGGVILFARNIFDADRTTALCSNLQEAARQAGDRFPLLIMIDQEGGAVSRYDFGTMLPTNMGLGAANSRSYAYLAGEIIGKELWSLGVNVNLAPVLDLACNPKNPSVGTRSFGCEPELVKQMGVEFIRGLQVAGPMATAKHFPGLGDASCDTHTGPAKVNKSRQQMLESDLVPFAEAFQQGVAMVMIGHCQYPELEGGKAVPASLSHAIATDLLRSQMGFAGPAITDDLEMGAILSHLELAEAAVQAICAGADMVLICHSPSKVPSVHEAILSAIKSKRLPMQRVLEATRRILWLKAEIEARRSELASVPSFAQLDSSTHQLCAYEMAGSSVCVVRDKECLLPLSDEASILVVHPKLDALFNLPPPQSYLSIHQAMLDYFDRVDQVIYAIAEASPQVVSEAQAKAASADFTILCTYRARRHPGQELFLRKVLAAARKAILVALDDPYDLVLFGEVRTAIAALGFREPSVRSVAAVLAGAVSAQGKIPVSLRL